MAQPAPHFSLAGIRFLQQLKRNNDREWFAERKAVYEQEVQLPWLAVIEGVNRAFEDFAPDYVKPPKKAAMRIYRDIRFSKNKAPFKTNVAAWWSTTTTERTSGGGFYAHVSCDEVVVAAGVYQPMQPQLLAIRRFLQQHHAEVRTALFDKKLRKLLPDLDSNSLTRMPKGFLPEEPAADLLLYRQCALSVRLPAAVATTPALLPEITKRFRAAATLVQLLNTPLQKSALPRRTFF